VTALKAVFLDLDETILFDEAATTTAFQATANLAQKASGIEPDALIAAVRAHAAALWAEGPDPAWCKDLGTSADEGLRSIFAGDDPRMAAYRAWGPGFRVTSWQRALADFGVVDDELARVLDTRFFEERTRTNPFIPGALEALDTLGARFRLALITNGIPDVQRAKIDETGIADRFETIVVSGELGFGKPNPEIYHHTLRTLGVAPDEAIMVGDNIRRDVQGAQAVGIRGVWIGEAAPAADAPIQPDITIRTLAELPALI